MPWSPYACQSAHGTQTAASLQTAVLSGSGKSAGGSVYFKTSGMTNGTIPSACACSASRSASQSRRKPLTSYR